MGGKAEYGGQMQTHGWMSCQEHVEGSADRVLTEMGGSLSLGIDNRSISENVGE